MKNNSSSHVQHNNLQPIRRVLFSVSDKTNLKELCECLSSLNCIFIATSSTLQKIQEYGYNCESVESVTHFPEILGGRVKTLHPNIFAGILARESLESDSEDLNKHNIQTISLVVCNLYPFQKVLSEGKDFSELVEHIDIGGVTLLRGTAKNFANVAVLSDPNDYSSFIKEVAENKGNTTLNFRKQLALKAFKETSAYDSIISATMQNLFSNENISMLPNGPILSTNLSSVDSLPENINLSLIKSQDLRYGENPQQKAALYKMSDLNNSKYCTLTNLKCLHGKELSYNNELDIEHALRLANEFKDRHTAIIIKHNNPCGVGVSEHSIEEAYKRAYEVDTISPFGGIVCLTKEVTPELAEKLHEIFLEVIIAPSFHTAAFEKLATKKNLRLVTFDPQLPLANKTIFTHVQGGFLVQTADDSVIDLNKVTYPTIAKPNETIWPALKLGMTVVKHVRSNAIVLSNSNQTLAIAGGFTNRIDAIEQCLRKAQFPLTNAILASDAFFPFPDSIELIKESGIKFIIQPGGSIQDNEVIKACNKYDIAMVFTGKRHFKH